MYNSVEFLVSVPENVDGRDFIVGDLHGCYDELMKLLAHVNFDKNNDRLFATGDLMDRGPKTKECLELLNEKWFFSVLGNHEDLLIEKSLTLSARGELSKDDIAEVEAFGKYLPLLKKMPLAFKINHPLIDNVFVVHSEILPEHLWPYTSEEINNKAYLAQLDVLHKKDSTQLIVDFFDKNKNKQLSYQNKQKLLWSRKIISAFYKRHKKMIDKGDFSFMKNELFSTDSKIFCGHNVVPFPMKIGQQYYIDTGAALGYSINKNKSDLFSQFGHEFFALSMVDITTGICYGCVSSQLSPNYGEVLKFGESLYLT